MTSSAELNRETTLRQIVRLVDLSRDIDRNNSDAAFRADGGEIVYVVDENVLEMFVRPFRHTDDVETFYGAIWRFAGESSDDWRWFEAQAALITAEFLVSRALPGSCSDAILMTEPHRWELASRVEELTDELRRVFNSDPASIEEALRKKRKFVEEVANAEATKARVIRARRSGDDTLDDDIRKLLEAGTSQSMAERIYVTRTAVAFLAADAKTEPLEQLTRVVTPPILSRLKTAQNVYKPTTKELVSIEREAGVWAERLVDELRRPGHRMRARAHASIGRAIWNDARSIAFLRWVMRSCVRSDQQLAFITGDALVFDAYRRWHATAQDGGARSNEPFLMRRSTQYSPIFNPDDTRGDLSTPGENKRTVLFSLIQQAVEVALLPLNFLSEANSQGGRDAVSTRELLALKLVDQQSLAEDPELAVLSNLLSDDWLSAQGDRIKNIRELWQETQRLAIGSSYDLVVARLNSDQSQLLASSTQKPEGDREIFLANYATSLLDRLVDRSLQLWLPLADEYLGPEDVAHDGGRFPKRFTIPLDLDLGDAMGISDSERGPQPTEIAFAAAARRALERQDVEQANRFAELAQKANATRTTGISDNTYELEMLYLSCVTQRYSMGLHGDHLRKPRNSESKRIQIRSLEEVKRCYGRASRFIHTCLALHYDHGELSGDIQLSTDLVKYLRALSERAALNLFMACSVGLSRIQEDQAVTRDAWQHIAIAKGDLRRFFKLERLVPADDMILRYVRRQAIANLASSEVVSTVLSDGRHTIDDFSRGYARDVERLMDNREDLHPLLRVELGMFLKLAGRPSAVKPPKKSIYSVDEVRSMKLPLDRALYRAILRIS